MSKSVIRANILNRNTLFGPTLSKIKKRAFTRIKLSPVTALLSVRHNVKQIQSHTYLGHNFKQIQSNTLYAMQPNRKFTHRYSNNYIKQQKNTNFSKPQYQYNKS